uniref:G_PROTEIN_RECEP_F1_2 domain-containing protein n=1 Tax=Schistosoma mansoni TaxID=6183 RepID=A0A5K4F7X4_SCHMA
MYEASLNFTDYALKVFRQCDLLKNDSSYEQQVRCIVSTVVSFWCGYVLPLFSLITVMTNLYIGFYTIVRANKMPRQIIYISGISLSSAIANIMFIWLWQFTVRGLPYVSHGTIFFSILNVSPMTCRFQRYMYAFSSTMMCNMHVCASLDRCLTIYIPTKMKRFPKLYGWYIHIGILLLSALMMIPFAFRVDWRLVGERILCWVDLSDQYVQGYHTLFSNLGLIQTIFLTIIDLAFLLKLRKQLYKNSLNKLSVTDKKHIKRSILLTISSISFIIMALCQAVFYSLARFSSTDANFKQTGVDYDIGDFFWYLNSIRELLDIYIYFKCFKLLRESLLCTPRRLSKGSLFKSDQPRIS